MLASTQVSCLAWLAGTRCQRQLKQASRAWTPQAEALCGSLHPGTHACRLTEAAAGMVSHACMQIAPAHVPKLEEPVIDKASRPEEQPQEVSAIGKLAGKQASMKHGTMRLAPSAAQAVLPAHSLHGGLGRLVP